VKNHFGKSFAYFVDLFIIKNSKDKNIKKWSNRTNLSSFWKNKNRKK